MRFLIAIVGAFTVAASAPAVASPGVMDVNPAEQSEIIVETQVISVTTRAPAGGEGTETTELRCAVTKIIKNQSTPKEGLRVGTQLQLVGECDLFTKPIEMQAVGYPSSRCDAGAWTAPFWMKQQKKDQALTLYLKHAIAEPAKKPIAGKLETVADRRPGPSPAIVTVVPSVAPKK